MGILFDQVERNILLQQLRIESPEIEGLHH
jgi:hypothetical protein